MKLVCRDCGFRMIVHDESRKHCPQCGSGNIHISINGVVEERKTQPQLSRRIVCRDCGFRMIVYDESKKVCPKCGSGKIITEVWKPKKSSDTIAGDFFCYCLCELLIPLIFFLILFALFIGSI